MAITKNEGEPETPRQRARFDLSQFGSRRPLLSRLSFALPSAAFAALASFVPDDVSVVARISVAVGAAFVGACVVWLVLYAYLWVRAPARLLAEERAPRSLEAANREKVLSVLAGMLATPAVGADREIVVAWRKNCERFITISLGHVEARMFMSCGSVDQAHAWLRHTIDNLNTKAIDPDTFDACNWVVGYRGPEGLRTKECQAALTLLADELRLIKSRLQDIDGEGAPQPPFPTAAWESVKPILSPILSVLDLERIRTTYSAINRVNRFGLDSAGTGGRWHIYDLDPPTGPGSGRAMPRLDLAALRDAVDVGLRSIA